MEAVLSLPVPGIPYPWLLLSLGSCPGINGLASSLPIETQTLPYLCQMDVTSLKLIVLPSFVPATFWDRQQAPQESPWPDLATGWELYPWEVRAMPGRDFAAQQHLFMCHIFQAYGTAVQSPESGRGWERPELH